MAAAAILTMKLERLRTAKPRIIQGADKELKELQFQLNKISWYESERPTEMDMLLDMRSQATEMVLRCNFIIDTFISDNEVSIWRAGTLWKMFLQCIGELEGLSKFKEEIGSLTKEIDEIYDNFIIAMSHSSRDGQPERARWGPPVMKESDVVGLKGDVEFLLNKAITIDGFSTICIVGMGGIGKTTLAWILYHHPAVATHFELRAWITLSPKVPSHDDILDILRELIALLETGDEAKAIYLDQPEERIHQLLSGRKYFIVLDEVWGDISKLFNAFPKVDSSSVLLVTSRSWWVMGKPECIHEVRTLDAKKSWEMFLKKAFPHDGKCPKQLEEIGKQIVKKCDGLPLAIEEAAELLQREKPEPEVWEKFLVSMYLKRTLASLELSYNVLLDHVKPCFLNLAFLREGTTIKRQKLVHLWVAGELVQQKPYNTYETRGYDMLNHLIRHSLIQVENGVIDHSVKCCYINNNVRMLAIKKATEDIGLEVLTKGRSSDRSWRNRYNLVIHCSREKFDYSLNQDQQLVSLIFHGGGGINVRPSHWKNLKVLKILDWEGFGLKILPSGVETLISLKYLGLRNNYLQELPYSLGQLKKLEVLDIAQNFLVEVPDIIHEMDSLRHLYMFDIICLNPLMIHSLENLQTLTYISLDNWAYKFLSLKTMESLRKLGIEEVDGNTNVRKLFASVVKLKKLEHLILKGFRFRRMPVIEEVQVGFDLQHLKLDGLLTRLPSHFNRFTTSLSLVNSRLDDDPMPTLKNISSLMYLKLQNAYSGKQMVISCSGFEKLKSLSIKELWHLRSVQVEEGALQKLENFEMISCPYLETLPEEIGSMSSLKELKMVTTRRIAKMIRKSSFISKIRKVDILP